MVETGVGEPAANSASNVAFGAGRTTGWIVRFGSGPPSAARRSTRYWTSSECGPGVVVRRVLELVVRDRQLEPVAEDPELLLGQLLGLVGDVARLDARPERPALDGLGEDHRRRAAVLGGRLVRGEDLAVVVAAAAELREVVVGQVLDERLEPRIRPEEVLPDVGAAHHRELLELAVDGAVHLLDQDAVPIAGQELVPLAAPDDLDDVPAGAAEDRLQLLDDLAVAADGPVEALQVAVDDERQVVQALVGGDVKRAERLGLVGLAVAQERPDARARRVDAGRGSGGSG